MEEWKPVEGFPGYEVSNLGHVRSYWHRGRCKYLSKTPRLLAPYVTSRGHASVLLSRGGSKKVLSLGRLVALAFVPNPEDQPVVLHKNGDPADNRAENLRWGHTEFHGTHPAGHPVRCKETGEVYPSAYAAAQAYGGYNGVSRAIARGQRYKGHYWEYVK